MIYVSVPKRHKWPQWHLVNFCHRKQLQFAALISCVSRNDSTSLYVWDLKLLKEFLIWITCAIRHIIAVNAMVLTLWNRCLKFIIHRGMSISNAALPVQRCSIWTQRLFTRNILYCLITQFQIVLGYLYMLCHVKCQSFCLISLKIPYYSPEGTE